MKFETKNQQKRILVYLGQSRENSCLPWMWILVSSFFFRSYQVQVASTNRTTSTLAIGIKIHGCTNSWCSHSNFYHPNSIFMKFHEYIEYIHIRLSLLNKNNQAVFFSKSQLPRCYKIFIGVGHQG